MFTWGESTALSLWNRIEYIYIYIIYIYTLATLYASRLCAGDICGVCDNKQLSCCARSYRSTIFSTQVQDSRRKDSTSEFIKCLSL